MDSAVWHVSVVVMMLGGMDGKEYGALHAAAAAAGYAMEAGKIATIFFIFIIIICLTVFFV